jgi:RimJ/RimL family protein N-acetyltransferase
MIGIALLLIGGGAGLHLARRWRAGRRKESLSVRPPEPVTLSAGPVRLVPLTREHVPGLEAAAADGELWNLRVTSVPAPGEAAAYVEAALKGQADGHMLPFAVLDAASGTVLGTTRYHDIVPAVERWRSATPGTPSAAAHARQHHLQAAAAARMPSTRWAPRLVGWRTDNFNFASQRAIERLGAKKDGVLRHHALRRDGTVRDTVMYSLAAGEWPEVKAHLQYLLARPARANLEVLIDFFYTLRSAKLPVSVKEYLTLLEALKAGVVGPESDGAWSLDDFYYLSRTALVKDEKHYDKFDRAFAAYFKGVEMLADFTKDMPLEWLRKNLELELSPEEKAKIEKMGWDELMETLKKRFEEQKERHEGGSKMIGTGGTSPFGAYGFNPQGIRIGQDKSRNKSAVKVWDQRAYKDYDDTQELGTRNIKIALRRLRKFAREGAAEELDLDDTIRPPPPMPAGWTSRWCPSGTTT